MTTIQRASDVREIVLEALYDTQPIQRSNIQKDIRKWTNSSDGRVLALVGEPGTGKTMSVAEIILVPGIYVGTDDDENSGNRKSIVKAAANITRKAARAISIKNKKKSNKKPIIIGGAYLLRHGDNSDLDTRDIWLSLAYQLSEHIDGMDRWVALAEEKLSDFSTSDEWFQELILKPCRELTKRIKFRKAMLILDGIDHLEMTKTSEILVSLGDKFKENAPEWLSVLFTCSEKILHLRSDVSPKDLTVVKTDDRYARKDTFKSFQKIFQGNVDEVDCAVASAILEERAKGSFLFANFIKQQVNKLVSEGAIITADTVRDVGCISSNLDDAIFEYFELLREKFLGGNLGLFRQICGMLMVARESFPLELLELLELTLESGESDISIRKFLLEGGLTFSIRDNGNARICHKAIAEWLMSEEKAEIYFTSPKEGHRTIIDICDIAWSKKEEISAESKEFIVRNIFFHLISAGESTRIKEFILDLEWCQEFVKKDQARRIERLLFDFHEGKNEFQDSQVEATILALEKAVKAVQVDSAELASQLLARLPAGNPLLQSIKSEFKPDQPWLRPVKTFMRSAQHPLRKVVHTLDSVNSIDYDETRIVTGSNDNLVCLWDIVTGKLNFKLEGHTDQVMTVALQGNIAASGSHDDTVRIWNCTLGSCMHVLEGHTQLIWMVKIENDQVISASRDRTIRVWDIESGEMVHTLEGHTKSIKSIIASGNLLASGSEDKTIRMWELDSGSCSKVLEGHTRGILSVNMQDQDLLISSSFDKTIRVWDVPTSVCTRVINYDSSYMWAVGFQNKRIISGCWDSSIHAWDLDTGRKALELRGAHESPINCIAIRDGTIFSGSSDNTLRWWDLNLQEKAMQTEFKALADIDAEDLEDEEEEEEEEEEGKKEKENSKPLNTGPDAAAGGAGPSSSKDENEDNDQSGMFDGHDRQVICIITTKKYAVSCGRDNQICIWKIKSGKFVRKFETGCKGPLGIRKLEVRGGIIKGLDVDDKEYFWELKTGQEADPQDFPAVPDPELNEDGVLYDLQVENKNRLVIDGITGFSFDDTILKEACAIYENKYIIVGDMSGFVHFLKVVI